MAVGIDSGAAVKLDRLSNADTSTGWSVIKLEGSGGAPSVLNSVGTIDSVAEGADGRATRTNKQRVLLRFNYPSGVDFTSDSTGTGTLKHPSGNAYLWGLFLAAGALLTKANGGMQICLSDGTNSSYYNVAGSDTYTGGFFKWATTTLNSPDETSGTAANLGDITFIGLVTDVGVNVTRFDNFVVDAIDVGSGLTFNGTTTTDKLFLEAYNIQATTAQGILTYIDDDVASQGNLVFSGTAQTSDTETLKFKDTLNGAYTYTLDITGAITFINTQVKAAGAVDYDFNSSIATAFTMTGGGLLQFKTMTLGAGQAVTNALFQDGGTSSISADLTGCTFNKCGAATLLATIVSPNFLNATGATAVITDDLAKIDGGSFTSAGTGHAVELTSIGGGSMVWSSQLSGYVAGAAGSPATTSSTGNEAIYVNVASGTLTINVASGASTPSIRTAGATVNVVVPEVTVTFNAAIGGELRIYDDDGDGNAITLGTDREGVESLVSASYVLTHSTGESGNVIHAQFMHPNLYEEEVRTVTLSANDQVVDFELTPEENN